MDNGQKGSFIFDICQTPQPLSNIKNTPHTSEIKNILLKQNPTFTFGFKAKTKSSAHFTKLKLVWSTLNTLHYHQ